MVQRTSQLLIFVQQRDSIQAAMHGGKQMRFLLEGSLRSTARELEFLALIRRVELRFGFDQLAPLTKLDRAEPF